MRFDGAPLAVLSVALLLTGILPVRDGRMQLFVRVWLKCVFVSVYVCAGSHVNMSCRMNIDQSPRG